MNKSHFIVKSVTAGLLIAFASACTPDSGGDAGAKASPAAPRAHLVELAVVQEQTLRSSAEGTGSLRAVRQVKLFNQEEGRITAVLAQEGDRVKRGQVLVRLDDRLLRAQLDKATANLHQAELDLERLQRLISKKLVPEDELARARTALQVAQADERLLRTRLGYMTIGAPFGGKISQRFVEPGDVAPKHTHLLTLIDPSLLVTDVQVSELVLTRLKVGDRVDVRIDALGKRSNPGRILRIFPTVDPDTRRGRIEIALEPVPRGARPGQFSRVTIHTATAKQLVIPAAALQRDAQGEYVFVFGAEDKVRRTRVESGLRLADKVEVFSGLEVGQRIVIRGFLGLSDGQSVKAVERDA
ncbi:MAG: efflux RND transporter periplasmic adaptor subunit [Acidiferrobacterales bacterium]